MNFKLIFYKLVEKFKKIGAKWDAMTPSKENAIDFAHQYLNEDPERMISSTRYSLEYVLAHSGETINERYRSGYNLDETDLSIPEMLKKYKTKKDIVVYRGVCDHVFEQMIENAKEIPGTDLFEKGFLATSLVKGSEIRYKTRLRIFVPEGTNAVYMGNVNDEQHFYEVDIQHDAHLKILSADDEYINCMLLKTA